MNNPIRFYLDEHIQFAIALELRKRGVDVLTVHEAVKAAATDSDQLTFAHAQHRVFVTYDDDFLTLHHAGIRHSGIVYFAGGAEIGYAVRFLLLMRQVMSATDMMNHVEYL